MTPDAEIMLPLKVATERASAELEALYERLERLEHGLDALVLHSSGALDSQSIAMLQELDMLRQSVGALADYLGQISLETDHGGMVDLAQALQSVPLRDMAHRLGGQGKVVAPAGQAELF